MEDITCPNCRSSEVYFRESSGVFCIDDDGYEHFEDIEVCCRCGNCGRSSSEKDFDDCVEIFLTLEK